MTALGKSLIVQKIIRPPGIPFHLGNQILRELSRPTVNTRKLCTSQL